MVRLDAASERAASRKAGWCGILTYIAGDTLAAALDRPGRHVACPVHGGVHGDGFRLFPDVETTGGGICATCGAFPDGFALLQWLFGWSFPQTLERVAEALRLESECPTTAVAWATPVVHGRCRVTDRQRHRARANLARLWSQALAPRHADAGALRRYLAGRGLDPTDVPADAIRLHPALGYWTRSPQGQPVLTGRFPALLAVVRSPDGRRLTLHRTYLRPDGRAKAPVPCPRKLLPALAGDALSGAAIRLATAGEVLGVAEGLETALAASALSGMPVWACLSATLLRRFEPPSGVRLLTIWVDKDRSGTGERAAAALRDRLVPRLAVTLRTPADSIPPGAAGLDWADVWASRSAPLPA